MAHFDSPRRRRKASLGRSPETKFINGRTIAKHAALRFPFMLEQRDSSGDDNPRHNLIHHRLSFRQRMSCLHEIVDLRFSICRNVARAHLEIVSAMRFA